MYRGNNRNSYVSHWNWKEILIIFVVVSLEILEKFVFENLKSDCKIPIYHTEIDKSFIVFLFGRSKQFVYSIFILF